MFTSGAAAQAGDPIIGTWKLNVEKSRIFQPPRSQTLKFEPAGKGVKQTSEGILANGSPFAFGYTADYDGKDYPIKGNPNVDTVSLKRVNASTVVRTDKKGGQVVSKSTREVSGQRLIITTENYANMLYEPSGQMAANRDSDPGIGTWNLNVGKSSFFGPAPKSQTIRYEALGKQIKISNEIVPAAGAPFKSESTAAYDGRDYATKGNPNFDTIALRRVDARTVDSVSKKDGEVRSRTRRTVSKDAKTMTISQTFYGIAVYDRQ